MDVIIPMAIITFVFAYLAVNLNKSTDDNRFFPLCIVFLVMAFVSTLMTSDAIMMTWNGTINDTAGGIYNATSIPLNTGGTAVWFSTAALMILFMFLFIMMLKEAIEMIIKLYTGKK